MAFLLAEGVLAGVRVPLGVLLGERDTGEGVGVCVPLRVGRGVRVLVRVCDLLGS